MARDTNGGGATGVSAAPDTLMAVRRAVQRDGDAVHRVGKMRAMPRRKARTEAAEDAQPDLFAEGYRVPAPPIGRLIVPADGLESAMKLGDEMLIATLRRSSPSMVEPLCSEVVSRCLEEAVPALEELWRRFVGFGIDVPLREQRAVLRTLARLDRASARAALKKIVLWKGLPASQLPLTLRAAVDAGLVLPAAFLGPLLGHGDAAVREPAFALGLKAGVSDFLLRGGLTDPSVPVRRAAAIALGNRGAADAREVLIAELGADPSRALIEALAAIGGDGAIVYLGRCAERHPTLSGAVVDALRDMESARAERLAERLEAQGRVPGADGGRETRGCPHAGSVGD